MSEHSVPAEPVTIRRAVAADRDDLYEICLLTGDAGEDASGLYSHRDLIGEVWVGPYLVLEPDLAFVADDGGRAIAYVLGAADTAAFEAACEERWWPSLRARYPDAPTSGELTPDQELQRWIHHPPPTSPALLSEYPAHLHIDLLPQAQGRGLGRRLIDILLGELRDRGVPGVHLGVDAANRRAMGFYEHLGFAALGPDPDDPGVLYGLHL